MKVLKFGGTSVGTPQRIKEVAGLITDEKGKTLTVLSAMSGTTNSLLEIDSALQNVDKSKASDLLCSLRKKYDDVIANLYSSDDYKAKAASIVGDFFSRLEALAAADYNDYTQREIVAHGELISTNLMHQYMLQQGIKAVLLPALEYMKKDAAGEPDFNHISKELNRLLTEHKDTDIFLTQGYICRNHEGGVDNLDRGGSDYTASIIGGVLRAEEVQIWTDIDGMHNNDPRFVEETEAVHNLHFEEAAELAYFGAKILHPTCIQPAKVNNVPVRLLNTMEPTAEGTLIDNSLSRGTIKAVAAKDGITAIKIKSSRMLLAYGFLKRVFEIFEKYETPIDMIATSEVGVSLTIDNDANLNAILEDLKKLGTVSVDRDMVIICVVGDLSWQNRGFEAKALDALRNIPVRMISYGGSNYNVSFLIRSCDKVKALRLLSYHLF